MGTTESTDLETSLSVNDFNLNEIVINNFKNNIEEAIQRTFLMISNYFFIFFNQEKKVEGQQPKLNNFNEENASIQIGTNHSKKTSKIANVFFDNGKYLFTIHKSFLFFFLIF